MARQFKSTDNSLWIEKFGNGSDGSLTVSINTTDAPIDATCSGTSGDSILSATNGSFAAGQCILIHQTMGSNAGVWELNAINSYSSGTISLKYPLQNTYTTDSTNKAQVLVMKQYLNVTVNSGITWTSKAWDSSNGVGGILAFFALGTVTVTGTISANGSDGTLSAAVSGIGYTGGARDVKTTGTTAIAFRGQGTGGVGSAGSAANGNGGGGGSRLGGSDYGGGAGGGHSTSGSNGAGVGGSGAGGTGGSTAGVAALTTMVMGGGGGGGAGSDSSQTGAGGSGGGIILIVGKTVTVTGSIRTNGGAGGGVPNALAGGGGGAGGSVLIKCHNATLGTNLITATQGGAGGPNSGTGGFGRVHIDYAQSYTGSTNPTLDTTQDLSLNYSGGGAVFALM